MAVKLPRKLVLEVREAIYKRADEFGYAYRNRLENGRFMNSLITDPNIGGKLAEFMPRDTIRTYIKDGVLNRYSKDIIKKSLSDVGSVGIVKRVYNEESVEISSRRPITICANKERIFIISAGTVAKWETALRKAIETASNLPNEDNKQIKICLQLASLSSSTSKGDKALITKGLSFIGADVSFCS